MNAQVHPQDRTEKRTPVLFMHTCLCDSFFDQEAKASVKILEYFGCDVTVPPSQTCCGQPAFNAGDWDASRKVVRHTLNIFEGQAPIVTPSGSCASMMSHGALLEFEQEKEYDAVQKMGDRTWELFDYLVHEKGVSRWPGTMKAKVVLHHACHTRGSGTMKALELLLNTVAGIEVLSYDEKEQCCGFGGTFSVSFPKISTAMGSKKISHLLSAKPDVIISPDMSCLMHQKGLAKKQGLDYPIMHAAEFMWELIKKELNI